MIRRFHWFALIALVGLVAACETTTESDPAPEGEAATFTNVYAKYLHKCADCHEPGSFGTVKGIETSLDFSTQAKAHATLLGKAQGLTGNVSACNGTAFVVPGQPGKSLLLATLDSSVRQAFDTGDASGCDGDAITDMTVKTQGGPPSAAVLKAIHDWIAAGAKND